MRNTDDWRSEANCKGMDVNIFFPPLGGHHAVIKTIEATCLPCPVREQCLESELSYGDNLQIGYFGGVSGRVRERLLLQRKRSVA